MSLNEHSSLYEAHQTHVPIIATKTSHTVMSQVCDVVSVNEREEKLALRKKWPKLQFLRFTTNIYIKDNMILS